MRGKVSGELLDINQYGITPAYAGKSTGQHFLDHGKKDHPRLCGEKFIYDVIVRCTGGSPPPMRGKAQH